MKLYGFFRSSCSWRVRIALRYKGLSFTNVPIHLQRNGGEQFSTEHQQRNPMAQVPVLEFNDPQYGLIVLSQSLAILEFLEERFPEPSILPQNIVQRSRARQIAEAINAGIQPLQNSATLKCIEKIGEDKKQWAGYWIQKGLDGIERMAQQYPDTKFLVSDNPSIADFCLIPQLFNARRFGCDTSQWHRLLQVEANCLMVESFQLSHPSRQDDAPEIHLPSQ